MNIVSKNYNVSILQHNYIDVAKYENVTNNECQLWSLLIASFRLTCAVDSDKGKICIHVFWEILSIGVAQDVWQIVLSMQSNTHHMFPFTRFQANRFYHLFFCLISTKPFFQHKNNIQWFLKYKITSNTFIQHKYTYITIMTNCRQVTWS